MAWKKQPKPRYHVLSVRLSGDEMADIERQAARSGKAVSIVAREMLFGRKES